MPGTEVLQTERHVFADWLGKQQRTCLAVRPRHRQELLAWLNRRRDLASLQLRPVGSGHSSSAVACPADSASIAVLLDRLTLDRSEQAAHERWTRNVARAPGEHLVRVSGGTTIAALNRHLASLGYALPNMGSYDAQTIAGAIATGTHGSGLVTGPLCDFVASIEIVGVGPGPKAVAWRIEPSDGPTDPRLYDGERFGLVLLKDGRAFDACVVGLGMFGVVTAVTLRVRDAFGIQEQRWITTWPELASGRVLLDLVHSAPFVDVVMAPLPSPVHAERRHRCLVTVRRPVAASRVVLPRDDARTRDLRDRLADFASDPNPRLALTHFLANLASDHPQIANHKICESLEQEADDNREVPFRSASHVVLRTSVADYVLATSAEVGVPLERTIDAVEATIEHLSQMHEAGYHHGSPIGIRFGASSRQYLSMHYGRATCTLEAPVLLGMRNDSHRPGASDADIEYMLGSFDRRLLAVDSMARSHWGQRHSMTREHVSARYPKWAAWLTQMRQFNPYGVFDSVALRDIAPAPSRREPIHPARAATRGRRP